MVREPSDHGGWQLRRVIPLLWLVMSFAWAVVIVVTDAPAWPLAIFIATTVGPLTALAARSNGSDAENA